MLFLLHYLFREMTVPLDLFFYWDVAIFLLNFQEFFMYSLIITLLVTEAAPIFPDSSFVFAYGGFVAVVLFCFWPCRIVDFYVENYLKDFKSSPPPMKQIIQEYIPLVKKNSELRALVDVSVSPQPQSCSHPTSPKAATVIPLVYMSPVLQSCIFVHVHLKNMASLHGFPSFHG